jgi:hypothetical protein
MEAMTDIDGGGGGESDGESGDEDGNDNDISEMIRLASAAAVRDATRMKRSDSDLSISTGNDDDILDELLEEDRFVRQQQQEQQHHRNGTYSPGEAHVQRSMSIKYMEQASYEASLVEDGTSGEGTDARHRRTQLKPSGSMGRMASRMSSLGIIDVDGIEEGGVDDSVDDGEENTNGAANNAMDNENSKTEYNFRGSLRPPEFKTFHNLKSLSDLNVPKDTSDDDDDEDKGEGDGNSPQRTRMDSPTTESSYIDLLDKCGMNTTKYKADGDTEGDQEILLLYALFDGFCRPPLEMDSVRQVIELERLRRGRQNTQGGSEIVTEDEDEFRVDLPVGVVIQRPCDVLLNLLTSRCPSSTRLYLEKLPPVFVSSLFRILLRLLEGYTDSQYDSCVILASCPWQNEAPTREQTQKDEVAPQIQSSAAAAAMATTTIKMPASFDEKIFVGTTNDATANANLMYSIVRLRMKWQTPIKSMLLALSSILYDQQQQQRHHQHQQQRQEKYYLVFPMIRLVGLLCVGGVTVDELRRMIAIASDSKLPIRIKLLMTRALSVAASATAPATITPRSLSSSLVVLGKTNPLNFFSFISGPGITRTIHLDDQQQATWPFRNDFGAAFNFRVEDFSSSPSTVESSDGSNHLVLLQALSETGSGIEISLDPLPPQGETTKEGGLSQQQSQSTVAVLVIKTIQNHKTVACIKVNNCPLHARVWYHVAVRHTRSRLKGVFSLSSREQLTVVLDGKPMLTEAMKFPQIKQDFTLKQTLSFHVGKNLDGQLGSIYIFRDNASDATFKALFEVTSSETTANMNAGKALGSKRGGEIAGQSHQTNEPKIISSRNVQWDDLEHIAFSHNCRSSLEEGNVTRDIADLDKNEEKSEANNPLSKSSFSSRLYISWNPRRKEKNFLMELQSGAHVSLDHEFVQAVCIENAQKVIGSIGGIQNLLSVFQSMLGDKNFETTKKKDLLRNNDTATYSLVPDLLILLSCFVRGNHQNARELLRCGGISIVEQLLLENKTKSMSSTTYKKFSMIRSLFVFPSLSKLLVEALLEFRSSCSHCIALEKEVFSALLFNIPLWFEWRTRGSGVSLYRFLLPVLSCVVQDDPAKVRDCVGATSMISHIRDTIEMSVSYFFVSYFVYFTVPCNNSSLK